MEMIFITKNVWSIFFKGNMNAKLVTEVLSSKLNKNKNYLQQQNYSSIDNDSKHKNLYAYEFNQENNIRTID